MAKRAKKSVCATCGTCPTCGAAKPVQVGRYIAQPYPIYMWPYSPLPYYTPPVYPITCGGFGASTSLSMQTSDGSLGMAGGLTSLTAGSLASN